MLASSVRWFFCGRTFLSALCLVSLLLASGCSDSKSSNSNQTAAPSNLVYLAAIIPAITGQPITTNTPTVSGTVTSYSITPALSAGLSLNTITGAISGTPTAYNPGTTYTITASNASGSTTTTVLITVNIPTPSSPIYPQTTISGTVGQAITPDTPTVTGTVSSYAIAPALPAGLSLNTTTGTISGTPTAPSPQTAYTITASNVAGSAATFITITVNIPPPTGLTYPQTMISITVGLEIAPDTPTVTGTVSSYAIAPALPAGLSLNTTTGTILGTPTISSPQATYTITASNSSGSTSTTIQITVNPTPPYRLVYPQLELNGVVGEPFLPLDIPSYTGDTVTSFSISPALPAGLAVDATTGAIVGTPTTPTAVTANTKYTVTASNAGGSTTGIVYVSVSKAGTPLLDLGHENEVTSIHTTATRVLSDDNAGHWVLWDYGTGAVITRGPRISRAYVNQANPSAAYTWSSDIAGNTVAIAMANAIQTYSATDGHLMATMTTRPINSTELPVGSTWWKLASDGSYIATGSKQALCLWSPSGSLLLSRSGDYSAAVAFASAQQIQLAMGPAGNVIETITISSGASSTGPAFSGTFNSWFLDGGHFLTNVGTTVWTYSNTGVQQGIVAMNSSTNLVGQGGWISTTNGTEVSIYAIGANSPSATYPYSDPVSLVAGSNLLLGIFNNNGTSIVDLSGSVPVKTDLPAFPAMAFAASSTAQWVAGGANGLVMDGASLPIAPRLFNRGMASAIAGTTGRTVISTADGQTTAFDTATLTPLVTITGLQSSKMELSSDGTILAARRTNSLDFYSLPSGNLIRSISYPGGTGQPSLTDFSLAGSGTLFGQVVSVSGGTVSRQVQPVNGGPPIWSDTGKGEPIRLSPDGTLIAVADQVLNGSVTTNVFKNGVLQTAIPGWPVGWLDNNRLLVNNRWVSGGTYNGASIYDATGANLGSSTIPQLTFIQPISSDLIFSISSDLVYSPIAVFSLSTGSVIWGSVFQRPPGAFSDPYIVSISPSGNFPVSQSGDFVEMYSYQ